MCVQLPFLFLVLLWMDGQISCGSTQTAILTTDGQVYTAGKCEHFSLGHGDGEENKIVSTPRLVETLQGIKIVDIDMGDHHCAAVSEEGEVFTWGYGGGMFNPGGLGHGDKTSQSRPALVEALADQGIKIKQVSCGAAHTIALDEEGKVYTWGRGDFGRLGNGIQPQLTPEPVELLENEKMIQVRSYYYIRLDGYVPLFPFSNMTFGPPSPGLCRKGIQCCIIRWWNCLSIWEE